MFKVYRGVNEGRKDAIERTELLSLGMWDAKLLKTLHPTGTCPLIGGLFAI